MLSPGIFGIIALLILIYVVWKIVVTLFQSSNIIDSSTDIPDFSPMVLTGAQQAESDLSSYFPTSLARTTAPNVPDPAAGINSTASTADKLTSTAPNTTTVSDTTPNTATASIPNTTTVSSSIPNTTTASVPDPDIPNGDVVVIDNDE